MARKKKKATPSKKTAKPVKNTKKSPSTGKKKESKKIQGNKKKVDLIPVRIKKHRDKNGGHHHIIFEDLEDKHVSVGMTTKQTKGKNSTHKNYRCEKDPLGRGKESFLRRQGTVAPRSEYSEKENKGAMTPKDFQKAKGYADKAKQKYLNKKK